jgi:hypothetical protein
MVVEIVVRSWKTILRMGYYQYVVEVIGMLKVKGNKDKAMQQERLIVGHDT